MSNNIRVPPASGLYSTAALAIYSLSANQNVGIKAPQRATTIYHSSELKTTQRCNFLKEVSKEPDSEVSGILEHSDTEIELITQNDIIKPEVNSTEEKIQGKVITKEDIKKHSEMFRNALSQLFKKREQKVEDLKSQSFQNTSHHVGSQEECSVKWYTLPDEWKKEVVTRPSRRHPRYKMDEDGSVRKLEGKSRHDVYLYPPRGTKYKGHKLRSHNDILRWVQEHPYAVINTEYVNCLTPLDQDGKITRKSKKLKQFTNAVNSIQKTRRATYQLDKLESATFDELYGLYFDHNSSSFKEVL